MTTKFAVPAGIQGKIEIRDGYYFLIIVQDGKVTHYTPNVSLSHADFVKRSVGTLPEGAWVGSATKNDGYLTAINSYTSIRTSSQVRRRSRRLCRTRSAEAALP